MKKKRNKRNIRKWSVFLLALGMLGCFAVLKTDVKAPEEMSEQEGLAEEEPMEEASSIKHVEAEVLENPGQEDSEKKDPEQKEPEQEGSKQTEAVQQESAREEKPKYERDIAALDNTAMGWGPGVHFDEKNRPAGAVTAQEQYGKYAADFVKMGEDQENRIYLTFDEGYENGYTAQILDVLKEKNCPAVFFVTMPYVKQQPELIQRMIDEGHIVGNHSVTHPAEGLPSQTKEQQERELIELHAYMKENFDYEMTLFRYPAGKYSEQSLAIVQQLGYTSVFWSFAYKDWDTTAQPDKAESLAKLKERLHPGAIYLLHAVSETNTSILGQFIDEARGLGYEFVSYN